MEIESALWLAMHAGPWQEVTQSLRDWYALSCLILARSDITCYWADRGLIFGGPYSRCADQLRLNIAKFESSGTRNAELDNVTSKVCEIAEHGITLDKFVVEYYIKRAPVFLGGLVKGWGAVSKWADRRFWLSGYGHRWVPVEKGVYTDSGFDQEVVTIKTLIESFGADRSMYLAQYDIFSHIPALDEDIYPMPDFVFLGDSVNRNLFFGPAGKYSPLHTDPQDNVMCVVFGKKLVRLYSPGDTPFLYPSIEMGNTSLIAIDLSECNPDCHLFPDFGKASGIDFILTAGDALFIPRGWWHFVKTIEVSANVALFF